MSRKGPNSPLTRLIAMDYYLNPKEWVIPVILALILISCFMTHGWFLVIILLWFIITILWDTYAMQDLRVKSVNAKCEKLVLFCFMLPFYELGYMQGYCQLRITFADILYVCAINMLLSTVLWGLTIWLWYHIKNSYKYQKIYTRRVKKGQLKMMRTLVQGTIYQLYGLIVIFSSGICLFVLDKFI